MIFIIASLPVIWSLMISMFMVNNYGAKAQGKGFTGIVHDYILNFIGGMLGWAAAYYVLFFRLVSGESLTVADTIIVLIAFAGITGYLPHLVINKGFKGS